jgi:hypothetical protein
MTTGAKRRNYTIIAIPLPAIMTTIREGAR